MFNFKNGEFENTRQGYLFSYVQMIFNQFKRLALIETDKSEPEGFRKFTHEYEKKAESLECKVLCILSTALFLEAYIFDYCARKKSASFFKKYLDKLDPVAKWVITTRLLLTEGISEDDEVIERLNKLFKTRNELVHHKTKNSEDFMSSPEIPEELEPIRCIRIIQDLLKKLLELDNEEQFADYVLSHLGSWAYHSSKDPKFYPIPWEA